ncbi:unnamed protein product [Absidia cylindrospora]
MSLMEPQSKPTSNRNRKKHHRHSFPVIATTSVTPTSPHQQQQQEQQQSRRHSYHFAHHHQSQGRRYAKHRMSSVSGTSFTSSSSTSSLTSFAPSFTHRPFNTFEIVFTNIVDALIFTSAIAITAYNYWMGYIVDPPRIYGSSSPAPCVMLKKLEIASPLPSSPSSSSSLSSTSTPALSPASPLPSSSIVPPSSTNHHHCDSLESDLKRTTKIKAPELQTQHEKINTVNLSDDGSQEEEEEEEEDRVNRMEETLQELIRQGQAALTSPY